MTEQLYVLQVLCKHGDVKTTITSDWPGVPEGLVAVHDAEQPRCAPHYVREVTDADA